MLDDSFVAVESFLASADLEVTEAMVLLPCVRVEPLSQFLGERLGQLFELLEGTIGTIVLH